MTFNNQNVVHITNSPEIGFTDLATNCTDVNGMTYCNVNANNATVKMSKGMWKIYVEYGRAIQSTALI